MNALEFETDITGDTVKIPTHLLNRIPAHKQVKIILLLPEEKEDHCDIQHVDLKSELLEIGKNCAALPLLDSQTPDEILGYDKNGLPK